MARPKKNNDTLTITDNPEPRPPREITLADEEGDLVVPPKETPKRSRGITRQYDGYTRTDY